MSFSALSTKDAASKLKVDLIENGIGTQALHETVVAYRANRRAGTHSTKTKATVAGSGKKPWRQKGTGNARSGYKSSPVWSGGGVVFGPHPRDYSKKTNKTVKQLALRKAISSRVNAGEVYLIDPISLEPVPLPYDDAFWDRLHAHFDEGEIADLTYSITTWIATGRVVHALGLDGACAIQPATVEAEPGLGKTRGRAAQDLVRT